MTFTFFEIAWNIVLIVLLFSLDVKRDIHFSWCYFFLILKWCEFLYLVQSFVCDSLYQVVHNIKNWFYLFVKTLSFCSSKDFFTTDLRKPFYKAKRFRYISEPSQRHVWYLDERIHGSRNKSDVWNNLVPWHKELRYER